DQAAALDDFQKLVGRWLRHDVPLMLHAACRNRPNLCQLALARLSQQLLEQVADADSLHLATIRGGATF
ncbi:MAG: hypothetical protein ACREJM_15735, partial [Candidatus Saccharimonadales bacterium]